MVHRLELCAFISIVLAATSAHAVDCGMGKAFTQPDDGGRTQVNVWATPDRSALLFGEALHVNTDGTTRSYSIADFWGEKTAINNLCNAMSDGCAGLTSQQLQQRREQTQEADKLGWPADELAKTKISRTIIAFDEKKKTWCKDSNGYLVSQTALAKRDIKDPCDQSNYLDSLKIPAIVIPKGGSNGFAVSGVRPGDVAIVMSRDGKTVVPAIVGDLGPSKELGEGSVALNGKLLGKTKEPVNYLEIRGKGAYRGQGWDVSKAYVIVFPKTRSAGDPYMTVEAIDAAANGAFAKWGGSAGKERLQACAAVYK
jgi:hypothetical protein